MSTLQNGYIAELSIIPIAALCASIITVMEALIRAENLTKQFTTNGARGHTAVRNLSLAVREGEVLGFWVPTARARRPPFGC